MKKLTSRCSLAVVLGFLVVSIGQSQLRSGKFGIGLNGAAYLMQSDYVSQPPVKFGGGVGISWSVIEHLGIRANLSGGQLGWKQGTVENITMLMGGNFYVSGDLFPHEKFNPFVFAGIGAVYYDPRPADSTKLLKSTADKIDINYLAGLGADYFLSEFMSLTLSGEIALTNTDNLDALKAGGNNDYYYRVNLEFRYYFFDQDFITKLLEAVRGKKK